MGEFECRGDLALRWIGGVLVELKFFDRDFEWPRLELVSQALHQNLRREKFFVEDDFEFLVRRPVHSWLEEKMFVSSPHPFTGQRRIEPDARQRCFLQILQVRRGIAESNIKSWKH